MRRRLLGTLAAVVMAAIGVFLLVAYVHGAEDRALAGEELVPVLVVNDAVDSGTDADGLVGSIRLERVPAKVRADGAVSDLDDLEGLVATIDLFPGEQLTDARFAAAETLEAASEVEPPPGTLEVTVSLAPERAIGGQIQPGDTVAVLASFDPFTVGSTDPSEEGQEVEVGSGGSGVFVGTTDGGDAARRTPNSTALLLRRVTVTNVQVEQLPRTYEDEPPAGTPDLAPTGNLMITLAVTPDAAEKLVFTAEHGFVWLASDPTSAREADRVVETRETIYE